MNFRETLLDLGVLWQHDDVGYFVINNRKCRYLPDLGRVDVGEDNSTFDRWANSVEFSFSVFRPSGYRQFMRWVNGRE